MRTAFSLIDKREWRGGYNYLLNFFSAIDMTAGADVQPVLFAGEDVKSVDLIPFQSLRQTEVVISRVFNRRGRTRRQLLALATGKDVPAEELFISHGIDVVFENAWYYGRRFQLPVIAWLPDFQHRHLPHMFKWHGYWKREMGYRRQVSSGRCILLSSRDARQDLKSFYPANRGTLFVIPFAVEISEELLRADPTAVRKRYRLPKGFFFLPNQFYKHKNHELVLSALRLLKSRGVNVVVALSGTLQDPRTPRVINRLNRNIRDNHLEKNVHFLGSIPYTNVIGLMRSAAALVNPSLFEGWSTTVEEAKSLGVKMILSDLAVHREQADGFATFFKRHSSESLAEALAGCAERENSGRVLSESRALIAARKRRRVFAQDFTKMVHLCAQIAEGNLSSR